MNKGVKEKKPKRPFSDWRETETPSGMKLEASVGIPIPNTKENSRERDKKKDI